MKSLQYIVTILLFGIGLWSGQTQAQAIFNDTILFQILKIRPANGSDSRYLMDFQTAPGSTNNFTGKMVLSMCSCYCDSIWDAWPTPSDSLMAGGTATITYMSSSGGPPLGTGGDIGFGTNIPERQRGILNIWQMPGSFLRPDPFSLPVVFKLD